MDKTELTWLGQSFFRIRTPGGKIILCDPWKKFPPGNSLFPKDFELGDPDLILISHGHLDHLGDAVEIAKGSKPSLKIVSIFEIMIYFLEQGVPQEKLQPMNKGGSISIDGITVTMVEAVHSSGIGAFGPKSLTNGGEAAGFIIRLEDGTVIYHAGDTDVFSDMKLIGERFKPEIALLPIGGVFTMDPEGAAHAASLIHPKKVIPMHFGGTFGLPGTPEAFERSLQKRVGNKIEVIFPEAGKPVNL